MPKTEVIHERFPYRYVRKGTIELNGKPDYRIQKMNEWSRQYLSLIHISEPTRPS